MNIKERDLWWMLGVFTLCLLWTILIFPTVEVVVEKRIRKDAVAHGAAHYAVDTNGVVSFEWNK